MYIIISKCFHVVEGSSYMSNIIVRLRALKFQYLDGIFDHAALNSLSRQFNPFKISYNSQKEK